MPTIIELIVSKTSERILRKFTQENEIEHKGDFHATLFYSNGTPFFKRTGIVKNMMEKLPLEIELPYGFSVFGKDSLVLKFNNSCFTNLQDFLIKEALRQILLEWPDLEGEELEKLGEYRNAIYGKVYRGHPHITLANNFQRHINRNLYFNKPIIFDSFNWSV